jgi:glycosyltransferase involved in cell wall biosynthesis
MRSQKSVNPLMLSVFGLVPKRIGGTERYCRELSLALDKCGWQSALAFEGSLNDAVKDYLQLPSVTIETVPSMTARGIGTPIEFQRLIRRLRPDIVHLHYTGFLTPFPWLARLCGVKRVLLTNHASYPEGFQPRRTAQPKRLLGQIINAPVNRVICPSEFGRRCLAATGQLPDDRYQVVYNATHPEPLAQNPILAQRFRDRYQIPNDRIIVTQVGQLIPEKGVADLIAAFQHAASLDGRLHLVLVGEGDGRTLYERLIAEAKLSGRVTLTGMLADPAEAGVFEASDIFCLASRWEELFGFVLIEAMTRSKPVVATRVGGIPEVVLEGETGYLVERRNTQALAARLLELAAEPQLRDRLGRAGRERVATMFDVRKNVGQVLELCGIEKQSDAVTSI